MKSNNPDREFFEQAVTGLLDRLYGAALRLSRNRDDAEDLVAETVAKAWASLAGLHDRQSFRPWVFRILTNTYFSTRRKHVETSLEALATEPGEDGEESAFSIFEQLHQPFLLWWGTPEQEFLNRVLREHLTRALDALPEAFRVVVVLAELEGFSYPEIAHMLDVPVGTVRSRLSRGRAQLQQMLWQIAEEAGLMARTRSPAAPVIDPDAQPADKHHEQR